jgi:HEAT repeat protein
MSSGRGWKHDRLFGRARACVSAHVGLLLVLFASSVFAAKAPEEYARDLESSDRDVRREAAYQLSRLGPEARVALKQLIEALEDDQQQVWFGAVTALANLGREAEPALPALMKALDRAQSGRGRQASQTLYRTAFALGSIGPAAVPALKEGLSSDKPLVRAGSAIALGFIAPAGDSTLPALIENLGHSRVEVREAAAETLGIYGAPAVEPLIRAFEKTDGSQARHAIADALWRIGPAAAQALPMLRSEIANGTDATLVEACIRAYARIEADAGRRVNYLVEQWRKGPDARRAAAEGALLLARPATLIPAIVPDLRSSDMTARTRAAELLEQLGSEATTAAPILIELLRSTDPGARAEPALVRALGAMGREALKLVILELERFPLVELQTDHWTFKVLRHARAGAVPDLMDALGHDSAAVRAGALEGLIALADEAGAAAKLLPPLLDDPEPGVRSRAWIAAANCGVPSAALVAHLDGALSDPDTAVRRAAMQGISRLGTEAKPAVPRLIRELESSDASVQHAAVRALGTLGTDAAAAVKPLASALEHASADLQVDILAALGGFGDAAVPVLPAMMRLAGAPESVVRQAAIRSLHRLGEAANKASAVVARALDDSRPEIRSAAAGTLASIAPSDDLTVQALASALNDAESTVRRSAAEALATLEERARPAEARLFELLSSDSDRGSAVEALRAVNPTSVDLLMAALKHDDWTVRDMAVDALAALGRDAAEAAEALELVMREDPNEQVRRSARRALRRVRSL